MKARTESVVLVLALVLVAAFVASFVLGVLRGRPAPADPIVVADPAADTSPLEPSALARVEVLNASGRSGLARRATDELRSAGFDVIYFGNAPAGTPGDSSVVIDRTGDAGRAEAIAAALGIARVRSEPDPSLLLDASVILGADWPTAVGPAR